MPYLGESQGSQTSRMLTRKFSWEEDYYESKSNPVRDSSGVKPLNIDKQVPPEGHGTGEHVPRGGAFKVRRKPVNTDRASRFDRLSNSSGSISSVASGNSSPPASVSSRSSSASPPPQPTRLPPSPPRNWSPPASVSSRSSSASPPPPPARLPPSPPRTPPLLPQKCRLRKLNMPEIQCVSKNPLILPMELNPRPHIRGQSPPSPTGLILRDSIVQTHGNKLSVPRAQLPPSRPRDITENFVVPVSRPTTSTDKSAKSGVARRGSGGSVSPASSTGHYTAALDIGRAFRAPNVSVATKHGETGKPTLHYPTKKHTVVRTSPPPAPPSKNTPLAKPLLSRYRSPSSRSKNISTTKPLSPIYAGNTPPSPPLEGGMSSPLTPPIHYRPQAYFDPTYRGGYESDDSIVQSPPIRERYLSINSELTPVYRPPKSPGSPSREKPARPRIMTDLNSVEPLNVKHVPTPKDVHFAKELTSAEMQSEELTDILNFYLDEVVTDATTRGVMSSELKEFLKSPTIMGEWRSGDIVYTVQDTGGKGKGGRSVSIVRRALRD